MKKKVAIIGDGGWGTALGLVCNQNGHAVTVWGPFPDYLETVVEYAENRSFLPGVRLPADIEWTADPGQAVDDADLVIVAMPTKYFRSALEFFKGLLPDDALVVSVAKGLDRVTHEPMTSVARSVLQHAPVAALSGPSHAEEVARGVPTAVAVACTDADSAGAVQSIMANLNFRIYTSTDVIGVELGGALKNIIAIAVGVSDGLGFGDNTRAALITRGLAEITRLGTALDADVATFAGLSGMGDLIVTCTSGLSRNRAVGERIGRGEKVDAILSGMQQAAEGIWNCAAAHELAREKGVNMPVTCEVYAIVHEGKDPLEAVKSLLSRDFRSE